MFITITHIIQLRQEMIPNKEGSQPPTLRAKLLCSLYNPDWKEIFSSSFMEWFWNLAWAGISDPVLCVLQCNLFSSGRTVALPGIC